MRPSEMNYSDVPSNHATKVQSPVPVLVEPSFTPQLDSVEAEFSYRIKLNALTQVHADGFAALVLNSQLQMEAGDMTSGPDATCEDPSAQSPNARFSKRVHFFIQRTVSTPDFGTKPFVGPTPLRMPEDHGGLVKPGRNVARLCAQSSSHSSGFRNPPGRAASVRRVHPYDDPSSNGCIRRPRMHPQRSARQHSPKSPRCCAPRAREHTGTRTRCDAAEGESRRAGADSRARKNNANASSLVHLLPASVRCGHSSCVQGARGRTRTRSGDD